MHFRSLPAEYGDRAVFRTLHGPGDPRHQCSSVIQGILWACRSSESDYKIFNTRSLPKSEMSPIFHSFLSTFIKCLFCPRLATENMLKISYTANTQFPVYWLLYHNSPAVNLFWGCFNVFIACKGSAHALSPVARSPPKSSFYSLKSAWDTSAEES